MESDFPPAETINPYSPAAQAGAAVNPYAPPAAELARGVGSEAEEIRRELLNHEASIRGVGTLYLVGFWLSLVGTLTIGGLMVADPSGFAFGMVLFYAFFTWLYRYLGRGLRDLNPRVRPGVTLLHVLGLLAIPLGTLISAYILWLIHGEKGKRVLSDEYREIVAQTPHIQYKTPVWLVVLGLLFLGLLAFFVITAVMA